MVAFAERALADRPWLTGEAFSAADVVLASSFQWLRAMAPEMLPAMLSEYSTRAFARPAARRAIAIYEAAAFLSGRGRQGGVWDRMQPFAR
jgi:glutathione S-transferase